ncbi:MAG: PAS domain-containing protein [Tatlockia sp.]|nr:PAS domain-containing protein [Tatlockia sp.]
MTKKSSNKNSARLAQTSNKSPLLTIQDEFFFPQSLINAIPGYVYWKNNEGVYLGCNDAMLKLANVTDLIGKTDFDLSWKAQAKRIRKSDLEVIESKNSAEIEEVITLADNQYRVMMTKKTPLQDSQGITRGVLSVSFDISEQKNAFIQQLNTLENIIAMMPGNVYWVNKDNVYQGCNDNQAKLSGLLSRKDIIGKRNADLPWNVDAGSLPDELDANNNQVMDSGKIIIHEEPATLSDGKKVLYLSTKAPIKNEKEDVIGMVGISVDITELKETQKELHLAKDKAEAANYIMTEFIANLGHDLATPISDVGSLAQMLDAYSDDYPELKELFEVLAARANACEVVRKSIISATSISNLTIKPEVFSIILELLALETELRPTIGSKNVKLIIHPLKPKKEDSIETDRKKFHEILYDLLSNAINFTEEGEVTVSVLKEGELFHIKISDTGIGIPSDKFDYIFAQYTKLSRSNKYGATFKGVGAGLYLAKLRANSLNATISVESEVNKGSTFTLSIPATLKK